MILQAATANGRPPRSRILVCLLPCLVCGLLINADPQTEILQRSEPGRILVFGDSLTAGYGLGKEFAYPALLQKRADADGLPCRIVNVGVSGDTTAGGLRRLDWVLGEAVHIFILELGANDGLRGLSLAETKKNLQAIIDRVKDKNPSVHILIAGMKLPPNLGADYTSRFEAVYRDIAFANRATLVPFLLEGVAGHRDLNLEDGIHPNVEGHKIVAENVWRYLAPLLKKKTPSR